MKKLFLFVLLFFLSGCDGEITINLGDSNNQDDTDSVVEPVDQTTEDPNEVIEPNSNDEPDQDSTNTIREQFGTVGEVVRALYVDLLVTETTYEADTMLIPSENKIYSTYIKVKNIDSTLTYVDPYDYRLIGENEKVLSPLYSGDLNSFSYAPLVPDGMNEGYLHFDLPNGFIPAKLQKLDYYTGDVVAEIDLYASLSPAEHLEATLTMSANNKLGQVVEVDNSYEFIIHSMETVDHFAGYYAEPGYEYLIIDGAMKSLDVDTVLVTTQFWELITEAGAVRYNSYFGTVEEVDGVYLMPGGVLETRAVYYVKTEERFLLHFNDSYDITELNSNHMVDLSKEEPGQNKLQLTYQMETGIGGLTEWETYDDLSFRAMSHRVADSALYYYEVEDPNKYLMVTVEAKNTLNVNSDRLLTGEFVLVDEFGVVQFALYNYYDEALLFSELGPNETRSGELMFLINKELNYHLMYYDYNGWLSTEVDLGAIDPDIPTTPPDEEPVTEPEDQTTDDTTTTNDTTNDTTTDTGTDENTDNGLVRIEHPLTVNDIDLYDVKIKTVMQASLYQIQVEEIYFTDGKDYTVAAEGKDYVVVKVRIKNTSTESVWPSTYVFNLVADGVDLYNTSLTSTYAGSYDELVPGGCVTWELAYLIDESVSNLLLDVNPNVDKTFVVDLTNKDLDATLIEGTALADLAPYQRGDVVSVGSFDIQVTDATQVDSIGFNRAQEGYALYIYDVLVHNTDQTTSQIYTFDTIHLIDSEGIKQSVSELDQTGNSVYTTLLPNGFFHYQVMSMQKLNAEGLMFELENSGETTRVNLMIEEEVYTKLSSTYRSGSTKGISDAINWFDLNIKVNSIEESLAYDDGYEKVTLNFTIENQSSTDTITFYREFLYLVDGNGRAYVSLLNQSDLDLGTTVLEVNEQLTGELTFLIAAPNGIGSQTLSLAYFAYNFDTYEDVLVFD